MVARTARLPVLFLMNDSTALWTVFTESTPATDTAFPALEVKAPPMLNASTVGAALADSVISPAAVTVALLT